MSTSDEIAEELHNLIELVDNYLFRESSLGILTRLEFLSYDDRWQIGEVMLYKSEVPEELVDCGHRFAMLAALLLASFSDRKPKGLFERIQKRESEIMTAEQRMKAQAIAIEPPLQEATDNGT